jgi:hypothetical protein
MFYRGMLAIVFSLPLMAFAQTQPAQAPDHHQPMRLDAIQVSGTRLPTESIIRISGLKIGQMVDEGILKEATDKITATGLVKGIDYSYNIVPGKEGVRLSLNVFDEGPLLPAFILPENEAPQIWACLQSADPIFTREMPNTEKAIHFYSINIARCLSNSGRERVSATVACDGTGQSIAIHFHIPELSGQARSDSH